MANKRQIAQASFQTTFTLPSAPLGYAELQMVKAALTNVAPEYTVELLSTYNEQTTLILLPVSGDDVAGPSFVISQDAFGLRVSQVHWDVVADVGVFPALQDVVLALGRRLAFCSTGIAPATMTLH